MKDGSCAMCGKKALRIDYCSKTLAGEKTPDRSRISFACAGCTATAEFEKELKHDDGCKRKSSAPKKVCSKSGTPPHQTIPK